uniref:Uncharacterized protein n=1 Tax=Oryza punctata TaxID=4537 RepID=A0A0E0M256_ORYPU
MQQQPAKCERSGAISLPNSGLSARPAAVARWRRLRLQAQASPWRRLFPSHKQRNRRISCWTGSINPTAKEDPNRQPQPFLGNGIS